MTCLCFIAFLIVQNPQSLDSSNSDQAIPNVGVPNQTDGQGKAVEPPPVQTPNDVLLPTETKHIPSTGRKIITNFWSDQKAIWTSPLHVHGPDAKWWAIFGGTTIALIASDRRTSKALPNSVKQVSFSRSVSQIGAVYTTLPVAGSLYLIGRSKDNPHAREAGVLGAEALLDSYIAVSILKFAAGRERPDVPGGNARFFKGQRSFPSGHAMMSWSFASLVAHEYKGGKVIPTVAYSLASVVSIARFTAQKHFASDIVAGGAMGWFIGKFVFEHHLDTSIHKRYGQSVRNPFIPSMSPSFNLAGPREYALNLRWKLED